MIPLPARLSVISTPIGNLEDITLRALRCLKEAEIILCEDTRVTRKLLSHHGIEGKPLWRLQESNPWSLEALLKSLAGKTVALVTDSGTPGVSDPGAKLVYACQDRAETVPGPSSVAAALSVSGLGRDGFTFLGFLARTGTKIRKEIEASLALEKAVIFFESPHRILATLEILEKIAPKAACVLCRELTKMHEEILRGTPGEIFSALHRRGQVLGEITVVVENR